MHLRGGVGRDQKVAQKLDTPVDGTVQLQLDVHAFASAETPQILKTNIVKSKQNPWGGGGSWALIYLSQREITKKQDNLDCSPHSSNHVESRGMT